MSVFLLCWFAGLDPQPSLVWTREQFWGGGCPAGVELITNWNKVRIQLRFTSKHWFRHNKTSQESSLRALSQFLNWLKAIRLSTGWFMLLSVRNRWKRVLQVAQYIRDPPQLQIFPKLSIETICKKTCQQWYDAVVVTPVNSGYECAPH